MVCQILGSGLPIGWTCQYRIARTHRLLSSTIGRSTIDPPFGILPSDLQTKNVVGDCLRLMGCSTRVTFRRQNEQNDQNRGNGISGIEGKGAMGSAPSKAGAVGNYRYIQFVFISPAMAGDKSLP